LAESLQAGVVQVDDDDWALCALSGANGLEHVERAQPQHLKGERIPNPEKHKIGEDEKADRRRD
jgi:hypothetical protein